MNYTITTSNDGFDISIRTGDGNISITERGLIDLFNNLYCNTDIYSNETEAVEGFAEDTRQGLIDEAIPNECIQPITEYITNRYNNAIKLRWCKA